MSEKTKISWADSTWNPWRGCTPIATGCKNCYARTLVNRFGGDFSKRVRASDATFYAPLRWNKKPWICDLCHKPHSGVTENGLCPVCWTAADAHPRSVFVESLGDFWDDQVPIEWLADALDVIRRCPDLLFLIPSKRCKNWKKRISEARDWMPEETAFESRDWAMEWLVDQKPPSNVWIGASISTQPDLDRDIEDLLAIPAAKRFLSAEPMLGPIDLHPEWWLQMRGIEWIICGGESGPGFRPMDLAWARSLRDQCRAADVPFWFKQSSGPRPGIGDTLDGEKIQEWPK